MVLSDSPGFAPRKPLTDHPRERPRIIRTGDVARGPGPEAGLMKGFALVFALALALVMPAAASADSIVYVKDGNVWLSSPDASKQYQVTFDGGYSSPSQANDGTIAAIRAKQLVRLDRSGHVLSAIDAMGTANNPNFV